MKLSPYLESGTFIARLNRFAALVWVRGQETVVHVANSGRLRELFQEGAPVLITPVAASPRRKTLYDLSLVDLGHTLVSADARVPSTLVYEALQSGGLPQFREYRQVVRERVFGGSRLDLLLLEEGRRCYVEVKSVTLVKDDVGLFPDAPTLRGQRHVATLASAIRQGWRGAVVFVVQREDARAFTPNDEADPAFGKVLRLAHQQGVEIYAYGCHVTRWGIDLAGKLSVVL